MTSHLLDPIVAALRAADCDPQLKGEHVVARCPSHDDRNPSLSVAKDGPRTLIKCHAGCETSEVMRTLNMTMGDLFEPDATDASPRRVVASYAYTDERGALLFTKDRFEPKSFRIRPAGAIKALAVRPLYRLPEVLTAAAAGAVVYVVEGEKDADAVAALGVTATCNFDGATAVGQKPKWREEYTLALQGASVIVVADKDAAGSAHASSVVEALSAANIQVHCVQAIAGKDVSDHLNAGFTLDDLEPVPLPLVPPETGSLTGALTALDWHQLWEAATDGTDWVCEPILEKGRSTVLYSPPKAGKSLLSLEIAAALACGRQILGNPARPPMRVLYVDLENSGADIKGRLVAMGYGPQDLHELRYVSFPQINPLDTATGGAQLGNLVDTHRASLVVLDTVSRFISGPEDSADTFAALYRHSFVPLKARGVTVLRLDHSGKDVLRGQRGSSAKSADVDHVWRLSLAKDGAHVSLKREASRTGHGDAEVQLVRHAEPLRHTPAGPEATLPHATMVRQWLSERDVPLDAGRDRLRQALEEGGIRAGNVLLAQITKERKQLHAATQGRGASDCSNHDHGCDCVLQPA